MFTFFGLGFTIYNGFQYNSSKKYLSTLKQTTPITETDINDNSDIEMKYVSGFVELYKEDCPKINGKCVLVKKTNTKDVHETLVNTSSGAYTERNYNNSTTNTEYAKLKLFNGVNINNLLPSFNKFLKSNAFSDDFLNSTDGSDLYNINIPICDKLSFRFKNSRYVGKSVNYSGLYHDENEKFTICGEFNGRVFKVNDKLIIKKNKSFNDILKETDDNTKYYGKMSVVGLGTIVLASLVDGALCYCAAKSS